MRLACGFNTKVRYNIFRFLRSAATGLIAGHAYGVRNPARLRMRLC